MKPTGTATEGAGTPAERRMRAIIASAQAHPAERFATSAGRHEAEKLQGMAERAGCRVIIRQHNMDVSMVTLSVKREAEEKATADGRG